MHEQTVERKAPALEAIELQALSLGFRLLVVLDVFAEDWVEVLVSLGVVDDTLTVVTVVVTLTVTEVVLAVVVLEILEVVLAEVVLEVLDVVVLVVLVVILEVFDLVDVVVGVLD